MTKFSIIALAAVLGTAGLAAPALAATASGDVPYCSSSNSPDLVNKQLDSLSTQLQLSTKPGSSIEVWNGCLKVMSTTDGHTTVAFYDPDSLKLIDTLDSGSTFEVPGIAG